MVDYYFSHILERNLAAAERILTDIRPTLEGSAWQKGYLNALEGMLVTQRSGDTRYVYLSRLDLKDPKKIDEARRCFQAEVKNPLQGEFDRGFFSAWLEFLRAAKSFLGAEKETAKTLDGFLKE